MKYLVIMETVETAIPTSFEDLPQWVERVVPNDEVCAKLVAEKKILTGGALAGRKGFAFIMEAASNDELGRLLMTFPLFALSKVDVTPLESFEARAAATRQNLERLKATL
jgi:muconolactone delta-isomerase